MQYKRSAEFAFEKCWTLSFQPANTGTYRHLVHEIEIRQLQFQRRHCQRQMPSQKQNKHTIYFNCSLI